MIKSKLGIGPMSKLVIRAVIEHAYEQDKPLMLIASRNQIECERMGGGYVENFNTESFANFVKSYDRENKVILCRDHSGPFFSTKERGLSVEKAIDSTLQSIKVDIDSGFDLIHIDCCFLQENVMAYTKLLIKESLKYAEEKGRKISIEIGSEENIGRGASDLKKFESELVEILEILVPEFIVGQTGSLTKEVFQVGSFDLNGSRKLIEIAHRYGVKFKEHNGDYLNTYELNLRKAIGVDAINVAPEYGYLQTSMSTNLGYIYGFENEVNAFLKQAYESEKWRKWQYGNTSDELKAIIAGHYVFSSKEYVELSKRLNDKFNFDGFVISELKKQMDKYLCALH